MNPWLYALGLAFSVGIGWHISGAWRGTAQRGYLLALDHVDQMTRPARTMLGTTHTLDEALRKLRKEAS